MSHRQAQALIRWLIRIGRLLEYEPTWISEACFALGAVGWGLIRSITPEYAVHGWELLLPLGAIAMGLFRLRVLWCDWRIMRILLAATNALLVAWLIVGLVIRFRVAPNESWLAVVFICEWLTLGKFSMPCIREALERRHLAAIGSGNA